MIYLSKVNFLILKSIIHEVFLKYKIIQAVIMTLLFSNKEFLIRSFIDNHTTYCCFLGEIKSPMNRMLKGNS